MFQIFRFFRKNDCISYPDSDISLKDTEPSVDDDNEPHIGLQNVSDRLKELCGGTLTLLPRETGGVVVEIRIPGTAK